MYSIRRILFRFEKGSNHQNHSSASHHLVKKFLPVFTTFWDEVTETLYVLGEKEQ